MKQQSNSSAILGLLQHFRKLDWNKALPGLTQPEYLVLSAIHYGQENNPHQPGIYVSILADHLMTSVSMVSKLLKALEEKGWILRTVDKNSRRNTFVSLTPAGKKVLVSADTVMDEINRAVAEDMGEAYQQLISNISALLSSYEKVLNQI